jgi:peptide/nickel transport system substrate-binding protein
MGWRYAIISLAIVLLLLIPTTYQPTVVHAQLPHGIPREETLIAENFGGRISNPQQWNLWLVAGGPMWQSGLHQLCLMEVWYTNYTTGLIGLGTAAEPPIYNSDYTVLTIKLKPGVYWSDGVEHTAEDWVYTFKKALNDSKHGMHALASTWIKNVYAKDKYTLVIELKAPNPYLWTYFTDDLWSAWWWPMPAHIFEKVEAQGTSWSDYNFYPPVCLGPYKFVDVDPTGYWVLWERRDDWDRTPVGMWVKEHGLPWVGPKYVLYIALETDENRIAYAVRNDVDYIFDVTTETFEVITSRNPYARSWSLEWPYFYPIEPCVRGIYMNLDVYPYNLTQVRWALALAINATDFIISTHKGLNKVHPANIPYIPGTMPLWQKVLPLLEQLEITLPNGSKFKPYDPEVPIRIYQWAKAQGYIKEDWPIDKIRMYWGPGWWKYAPDVAAQLLESVGFKKGPDGRWYLPDGKPWTMDFKAAGTWEIDATRMAYGVAEQWRRFGIDVKVEALDSSTFWSINFLGQYEIGGWWGLGEEGVTAATWVRTNTNLNPIYAKPINEWSPNFIRLRDPMVGKYVDKLVSISPFGPGGSYSEEFLNTAAEYVVYLIKNMYFIPFQLSKKLPIFNTYYWVGYPTAESPLWAWTGYYFAGTKWLIPFLRPRSAVITTTTPSPTTTSPTPTTPSPTRTTPTPTTTPTTSPTVTAIGVGTVTVTVPTTITQTVVSTSTVTTTIIQTVTQWATTVAIAIVLLIVGFAIGWLIKRR